MMYLPENSLILHYLYVWALWKPIGYSLVFLGMTLEGDMILFTIGFLTQQGLLDVPYVFLFAVAGAVAGDVAWYWLGSKLKTPYRLFSLIRRWIDRASPPLDEHLVNRTMHTIFVSKFVYGFNHLILMRAGMLRLRLKSFIKANIIATIFWVLVVGGLGYLSGASFILIRRYLRFAEIALLIGLAIFFTLWHFVITKRLEKEL